MVPEPKKYDWVQATILIDWSMADNRQTVLVLNLPKKQQLQIQHKLPQIKARLNPFRWHMEFSSTLINLYDESFWLLRNLVRDIEKVLPSLPNFHFRPSSNIGAPNPGQR